MQKHIAAYGTDHVLPKHHFMYDVADAYATERTHIRVKQVVTPIQNTKGV